MTRWSSQGILARIFSSHRRALKRISHLEKELSTYKNQVLAHMEKNTQLAMELADTTNDLLKATENPLIRLKELPDDPDTCYVWLLNDDQSVAEFARSITTDYIDQYGHDPKALHLVLHGVKDITKFSKREVELQIRPWLQGDE